MKILFPCLNTFMVPRVRVVANNWNPNHVSSDKMRLLMQSIIDNGWCFPIVTVHDSDEDVYRVVDGFHRWTIAGPEWLDLPEVPIVVIAVSVAQRMAATVQFNKARGVHQVDLDADLIRALIEQGMSEEEISLHLSIEMETIHRYKSLTGIAALFANATWSTAWTMEET